MRFSTLLKNSALVLLLVGLSGCHGGPGGWASLGWNPASWGRPKTAVADANGPKKPSDTSLPSLAVTHGTQQQPKAANEAPPSPYGNTQVSYDVPTGGIDTSRYPDTAQGNAPLANNGYVAPQEGAYNMYGGQPSGPTQPTSNGYANPTLTPNLDTNPYRSPVEMANLPQGPSGYQPQGMPPANPNDQYANSLKASTGPDPARYSHDPNSRFYTGPPTQATNAAPNAPYGANVQTGAMPPANNYQDSSVLPPNPNTTMSGSGASPAYKNGQAWDPSNNATAMPYHPNPGGATPAPGSDYVPGQDNYYNTPQPAPSATPGISDPYGAAPSAAPNGVNPSNNAMPAPFRPGSTSSYPSPAQAPQDMPSPSNPATTAMQPGYNWGGGLDNAAATPPPADMNGSPYGNSAPLYR